MYSDFERAGRLLEQHRWIFAKTMPDNPHEYTLRREWDDDEFVFVVTQLRRLGYKARWKGRTYVQLNVNNHYYWTMGSPIDQTILINRKVNTPPVPYDDIAGVYDDLWNTPGALRENGEVVDMLGDLTNSSVLDVGCGTGLLLDYAAPQRYTGIDPSGRMIQRLRARHGATAHSTIVTPLSSFVGGRYDVIVALFGVASYLTPDELQRIPSLLAPGGRYMLMFYADGYVPYTHIATSINPEFRYYQGQPQGVVSHYRNFVIVQGDNT